MAGPQPKFWLFIILFLHFLSAPSELPTINTIAAPLK